MTNSSIEASSIGLKLSYVRFISDSAPGFVVLLLVIVVGGNRLESRWADHKELKVLMATLSFLLATPIGLALNAISYFVLGHVQSQINRICFLSRRWPVEDTRRSLMVKESTHHFGFNADDWAERNDVYGELLETYRPDLAFRIEPLRGLKRFSRSISFLAFVSFFCALLKSREWPYAILVAVMIVGWFSWLSFFSRSKDSELKPAKTAPSIPKTELKPGRFANVHHEIRTVIVLAVAVLVVSAGIMDVTCQVNALFGPISLLAVALFALLVTGMVDFYERATIAMYLHIECPPTVTDSLLGISAALSKSAKRLRA